MSVLGPTWVGEVVKRLAHDLERTSDIHQVHLVVQGDQHLNWLGGVTALLNCTHLDGIDVIYEVLEVRKWKDSVVVVGVGQQRAKSQ